MGDICNSLVDVIGMKDKMEDMTIMTAPKVVAEVIEVKIRQHNGVNLLVEMKRMNEVMCLVAYSRIIAHNRTFLVVYSLVTKLLCKEGIYYI